MSHWLVFRNIPGLHLRFYENSDVNVLIYLSSLKRYDMGRRNQGDEKAKTELHGQDFVLARGTQGDRKTMILAKATRRTNGI